MGEDRYSSAGSSAGVVAADFLRNIKLGQENILDIAKSALDGKDTVTIAMQNRILQPEPVKPPERAESPKRAHVFNSITGFIAYITKYKTTDTVILADVNSRTINCVLNDVATKGFEVISFIPTIHPLFEPWERLIEEGSEIREFVKFLMANKKSIVAPDAMNLKLIFSQVRASKKITVHKGIGNKSINGITCEFDIAGVKPDDQQVPLPETININVPIFIDTPKLSIDIDLILEAAETEIGVSFTSADVEVRKIEAFENFVTQLQAIEGVVVSLGNVNTQPWAYIQK